MSAPKYNSIYGAALNLAAYDQPVATPSTILSLDMRLDQILNDGKIAKAEGNETELARLRILWTNLKREMDAAEAVEAQAEAAPLNGRVYVSVDLLVAIHDRLEASKALEKAWDFVCQQAAFDWDNGALIVPSATWERVTYRATPDIGCTCPARKPYWHMTAAALVADALAIEVCNG